MTTAASVYTLSRSTNSVNPVPSSQLSLWPADRAPATKIYHNPRRQIITRSIYSQVTYGVSQIQRGLSPSLLVKRFDQVRDCLGSVLGLSTAEREVVLRLLRLYAYYGAVYPKAKQIATERGCSVATFWRTIRRLRERGLVEVINRYVLRPAAQISNLYRLARLLAVLAKYLAEHGEMFTARWVQPYLRLTWPQLWAQNRGNSLPGLSEVAGDTPA